MPRQIWIALLLAISTSLCAFGQDATLWTGGATPAGSYCYGGGTVSCSSYLGGTNTMDLNGSGIVISSVQDEVTGDVDGIQFGALYFTSGAYDGTAGVGGTWTWNGGGTLEITGCIAAAGITGCAGRSASNTVLLDDDFTSVTLTTSPSTGSPEYVFGGLQGSISSALITYLNGDGNGNSLISSFGVGSTATLDVSTITATPGSAFSANTVPTGSIVNTVASVPEDWNLASTLGLFGFGMVAFVIARRFRLIKPLTF